MDNAIEKPTNLCLSAVTEKENPYRKAIWVLNYQPCKRSNIIADITPAKNDTETQTETPDPAE